MTILIVYCCLGLCFALAFAYIVDYLMFRCVNRLLDCCLEGLGLPVLYLFWMVCVLLLFIDHLVCCVGCLGLSFWVLACLFGFV